MDRFQSSRQSEACVEAIRDGRSRLHPSLTSPHWLVLRERRKIFTKWFANLPGKELLVLDIGGRIQPYRPLLENRLRGYVAVDLRATPLVHALARGEKLPFRDGEFDLVICTQMLQYVPDPRELIQEAARVLKPAGCFILSVPSAHPVDSEHEYWRLLPAGLRYLLDPFRQISIVGEGSSITGFFRTMNICLSIFCRYPWLRSIFNYTACPILNLSGFFFERLSGSSNEQFTVNYSVLAIK